MQVDNICQLQVLLRLDPPASEVTWRHHLREAKMGGPVCCPRKLFMPHGLFGVLQQVCERS